MERITVLIADDHALFRKGIRKMLEAEDDMKVVGEAANGVEAVSLARKLMPDVILMDITMPELDGIEATRALHREMPHVGVVFVTMSADDASVIKGLQAGGRGYILKDANEESMLRAVRAVASGESLLGPSVAEKVMRQFAALDKGESTLVDGLTPREMDVLKAIAEGRSNKEIAVKLSLSEKTVKNHINNIFSKLHLFDRTQATLYAIRTGIAKV